MSEAFLLIHSPLVGPASLAPLAAHLRRRGHRVELPSLLPFVGSTLPFWPSVLPAIAAACANLGTDIVLVGHSGSGPWLPLLAAPPLVRRYLFLDARLPPLEGAICLAEPTFKSFLLERTVEGVLPRWAEWWGPAMMERLVPDPALRQTIVEELPNLPLSYFDQEPQVSPAWTRRPATYMRLSSAYESEAQEAEHRGWPVERLNVGHLHAAVAPSEVADLLLQMLGSLPSK